MVKLSKKEFEKIKNDYQKRLVLPKEKYKKPFFVCPVGLVGAGKTTVTKPLSKRLSLVRVSTDEIRRILKDSGHGYDSAREIASQIIDELASKGFSIGADIDCAGEGGKRIKKIAKKYKAKVFWLHINPPEGFILNKLRNYKHTWLFKNADDAIKNYYERKALHKKLSFPFLLEVDTSRRLEQQLKKAALLIKGELKR